MLSSIEIIAGKIWAELLHLDKVNPDDNFFELGGDSLLILTMLFRTEDALGVKLRPETLMDAPTFGEFCRIIDRKKTETVDTNEIIHCARKKTAYLPTEGMPVSFIQEQIVGAELAGLYDPDKVRSHCLDLCYRIKGSVDIAALDKALREIVRRHEILRTNYSVTDETVFQNVNDTPQFLLRVEDLRSLPQGERERETERILKKIATDSFSFFHNKLMMSATLITGETEHVLTIVVNHVAIDGLSMDILRNELFLLYKAFSQGVPSPLADLPIQYADFAVWEREYFSGDRLEAKLVYWRRFSDKLFTTLPVDHMPTAISYDGDIVPVNIPPELAEHLRQLGRECKVTLFTVLFAAFISLIHAFSGYRFNFFSIPVANRARKETQSLIGCFMNFQFVYINLSGNPTFTEVIERLNETMRDVYDNYVPFHFIAQQIPNQGPVVDFQLLNSLDEATDTKLPELSLFPFKLQTQEFALFPIDVRLSGSLEAITGHFKYQTAVYDRKTIQDMVSDYMAILAKTVHDPDMRLSDMGITPHNASKN